MAYKSLDIGSIIQVQYHAFLAGASSDLFSLVCALSWKWLMCVHDPVVPFLGALRGGDDNRHLSGLGRFRVHLIQARTRHQWRNNHATQSFRTTEHRGPSCQHVRRRSVQAAPKPPDYSPVDVGPKIREWEATPARIAPVVTARLGSRGGRGASSRQCLRDRLHHGEQDLADPERLSRPISGNVLQPDGRWPKAQVWVQANLAWPAGDPEPRP